MNYGVQYEDVLDVLRQKFLPLGLLVAHGCLKLLRCDALASPRNRILIPAFRVLFTVQNDVYPLDGRVFLLQVLSDVCLTFARERYAFLFLDPVRLVNAGQCSLENLHLF